jgi:hypothetical protein
VIIAIDTKKLAGQFKEILFLQTHEDNSGAPEEDPYRRDADVEFVKKANGYPDIRAKYSGTEKSGIKIQLMNKTELYTFDGKRCQLIMPQNKSPRTANPAQRSR